MAALTGQARQLDSHASQLTFAVLQKGVDSLRLSGVFRLLAPDFKNPRLLSVRPNRKF